MLRIQFAKTIYLVFFFNLTYFLLIENSHSQTLDESIISGYQISSAVINAQSDIHIYEKNKDAQIKETLYPSIGVSAEANHSLEFQPAFNNNQSTTTIRAFNFSLNQNIPVGKQLTYQKKKLDSEIRESQLNLLNEKQKVLSQVVTSYLGVYKKQNSIRLYEKNVISLREYYQEAQQSYKLGGITEVALLEARTNYLAAISRYNIEKSNLDIEKNKFKNVVGLSVIEELKFPEVRQDLPSSLEEAIELGLSNNILLAKKNENLNRIKISKSIEYTSYYPKISFSAFFKNDTYDLDSETDFFTHLTENNTLGGVLKIEYSLFNPEKKSKIKIKDLAIMKQTEEIVKTRKDIVETVSEVWKKLSQTKSKISEQKLIVKLSEMTLKSVQKEVSLGTSSILSLLDAEAKTLKKKVDLESYIIEDLSLRFELLISLGMMNT